MSNPQDSELPNSSNPEIPIETAPITETSNSHDNQQIDLSVPITETAHIDATEAQPEVVHSTETPNQVSAKRIEVGTADPTLTIPKSEGNSIPKVIEVKPGKHSDAPDNYIPPPVEAAAKSLSFGQLLKYSDKWDRLLQVVGVIFAIGSGVCVPCSMLLMGDMMDSMGTTADTPDAMEAAKSSIIDSSLLMFAVACIMGVCGFFMMWAWKLSAERQIARIRYLYFRGMIRQDVTWFDHHDPKTLSTRIVDDTSIMTSGMGSDVGKTLQAVSQFIAGYVIGFTKDWSMTLVILALGVPLCIVGSAFGILIRKFILESQNAFAESGGVAEEAIGGIRTVSSFGIEEYFINRYKIAVEKARASGVMMSRVVGAVMGIFMMVMYLTFALGLWYGGKLIGDDQDDFLSATLATCKTAVEPVPTSMMDFCYPQYSVNYNNVSCSGDPCIAAQGCFAGMNDCFTGGSVMTVFMSVLMGTMGLTMLGPSVVAIGQSCGSGAEVYATIDRIPPIDGMDDLGKKVEHLEGKIEFRNIKFRYPSRPDQVILNGMSLTVEAGKTIGLVGSSGCGKSTTIQLLQRFYDSEEGEILVDGMNIRDLNLSSFRHQMGFVGQEPILFNGSVKDNIRNGRLDASDEDIIRAAKDSNAHNFITEFPEGYDTFVGEGGHSLSGGQKQRIAIARALVRNPGILLLDEATSALDSESEKIVQAALDELVKQRARTTLIIAHRLSTIETADVIVVFHEGKIVEQGTHSELIAKNGIYADLRNRQMLSKKIEDENKLEDLEEDVVYIARQSSIRDSIRSSFKYDSEVNPDVIKSAIPKSRLWALARPEFCLVFIGTICGGISGAAMPIFGLLFSEMLQVYFNVNTDSMRSGTVDWACALVGFAVGLFIIAVVQSFTFGAMGERLTCRIRQMCFHAMLKQDVGFYDDENNSVGSMTSKLSQDATSIKAALGQRLSSDVQMVFTVIVALIIAFTAYWILAFVVIACFPFLVFGTYLQSRTMNKIVSEMRKPMEEAGALASEAVNGIRTLHAFGLQEKFSSLFGKKQIKPFEMGKKDAWCTALLQFYNNIISMGTSALALRLGGIWAIEGKTDYGSLMKVLMSVMTAAQSVGMSTGRSTDDVKVNQASESVFGLLDRVPPIDYTSDKGDSPEINGEIEFKDVRFRYPTRLDVPVLRKLNLKISKGQKIALVGSSGCGKSTIIGILQRFYNIDAGQVFIDGHEIRSINIKHLRKQFGLVGQEPVLFSGTIEENIKLGDYENKNFTHEEVVAAAKAANAHNFIMEFPEGYDTEVGNKGGSLSGGQKQRIAIARAIIRNPKILLLDEATSALDTESEAIVQEAIDKLLEGSDRTSIIVAHRLSTIKNADLIFVLDHGRVIEAGKHDQLMSIENGLYRQLATRQMLLPA